jgi:hypothetical protein
MPYFISFINKNEKLNYLQLRKKTSESSESGASCWRLAPKTRPVSLNTRSLVVDDTVVERSCDAKRYNCGKIVQCFFYYDVVADFDFGKILNYLDLFF